MLASLARQVARHLADSPLFGPAKALYQRNEGQWNLPLTKVEKLYSGTYLILRDYGDGRFPPRFSDQSAAYQAEMDFASSLPGTEFQDVMDAHARKPFWFPNTELLTDFTRLVTTLHRLGVSPPSRLLELGCGPGWMAEFLALMRFHVTATTISPDDVNVGQVRANALAQRNLGTVLEFVQCPMEEVDRALGDRPPYDVVFVYEALHHAFSWRQTIEASHRCLRPGGWLVICAEPNVLHTFISYRVARLSNTHEIGFSRSELVDQLRKSGFTNVTVLSNRVGLMVRPHWIAAQK